MSRPLTTPRQREDLDQWELAWFTYGQDPMMRSHDEEVIARVVYGHGTPPEWRDQDQAGMRTTGLDFTPEEKAALDAAFEAVAAAVARKLGL